MMVGSLFPALGPQDPQDQRKNSKNPPKKRPKIVILGDFLRPEGLRQALKKQTRKKDPQKVRPWATMGMKLPDLGRPRGTENR